MRKFEILPKICINMRDLQVHLLSYRFLALHVGREKKPNQQMSSTES